MTIERVRAVCAPRGDRSRGEQKGMSEIAVVLCTRNGEPTLGAVLEGYVSQETSGISWEMVIVDNGSTDVRWSRLVRQFGGLAKVDRVGFYAANFSIISAVA